MSSEPMALDYRAEWKTAARAAIETRARTGIPFTVDDIRADLNWDPPVDNMWGGIFPAARNAGVITEAPLVARSRRKAGHGRRVVRWVGDNTWTQEQLFDAA